MGKMPLDLSKAPAQVRRLINETGNANLAAKKAGVDVPTMYALVRAERKLSPLNEARIRKALGEDVTVPASPYRRRKAKHGGKRPGAGRKKPAQRVIPIEGRPKRDDKLGLTICVVQRKAYGGLLSVCNAMQGRMILRMQIGSQMLLILRLSRENAPIFEALVTGLKAGNVTRA